jgi:hypothetical protein
MKHSELLVFGKIACRYEIPLDMIDDLNIKYGEAKSHLDSYGPKLAGRLDSELDLMGIIQDTKIFKKITACMDDYINTSIKYTLVPQGPHHLEIIGCWMNDMVQGEYNPIHTHNDQIGFASVLFLKVPEFINDARDPHKFKDGQLTFLNVDGMSSSAVQPKVGDFYLFLASQAHCVNPFKTKKPGDIRRSMSFNFIIKDKEVKNET